MQSSEKRRIIDAHLHLYDHQENVYPFLDQVDGMFEALIGDYSSLPRSYLLKDYLGDETGLDIAGIVWHEFLSTNPLREVYWAQRLADRSEIPVSIVGLVDFLAPDLSYPSRGTRLARTSVRSGNIWVGIQTARCDGSPSSQDCFSIRNGATV